MLDLSIMPEKIVGSDYNTKLVFTNYQFNDADYLPIIDNDLHKGNLWYLKKSKNQWSYQIRLMIKLQRWVEFDWV